MDVEFRILYTEEDFKKHVRATIMKYGENWNRMI